MWSFRIAGRRAEWDWREGPPDLKKLESYRRPASGAASRHVPVRAYSHTVGSYIELESGLEHDLLRVLDRDPSVTWIVPQPFRLEWADHHRRKGRRHTPDLLSVNADGSVTVWDVKNLDATRSPKFAIVRDLTQAACRARRWKYRVFTGLDPVHRHNLMWLHAYRQRTPWTFEHEADLAAACSDGIPLGELVGGASDGERLAVLWHLIWTGRLAADLEQRLTSRTEVRVP